MKLHQHIFSKENSALAVFLILLLFRGGYFYYESSIFLLMACFLMPAQFYIEPTKLKYKYKGQLILPFLYFLTYLFSPLFYSGMMQYYGLLKAFAPFILVWALVHFYSPWELFEQFFKAYVIMLLISFLWQGLQMGLNTWESGQQLLASVSFPVMIKGRFTGFLQYANVNAILSLLAGFYAIYRWNSGLAAMICGFSLGLSGSRTSWVLAVFLLIAGVVLGIAEKKMGRWKWQTRAGMCKAAFGNWLFVLATVLGAILLENVLGENRLQTGLGASELQTRLLYYKDGISMILNRPWGYGHYGYYLVQRQFQTGSTYLVKYIHNFLLQFLLDGGILSTGVIVWLISRSLWLLLTVRSKMQTGQAKWVGIGFLALLAHAFFDFDFEFNYVMVLVWLVYFYALELKMEANKRKAEEKPEPTDKAALNEADFAYRQPATIRAKGIWLSSFCITMVLVAVDVGTAAWNSYNGNHAGAIDYGFSDARIGYVLDDGNPIDMRAWMAHSNENYSIKSVETIAFLRNYYYNKGKLETAIEYGKKAVEMAPLWMEHRQELMRIQYAYALTNPDKIQEVAEDILSVPDVLRNLKETKSTDLNVRHRPKWEMTEEMRQWYNHFQKLYDTIHRQDSKHQKRLLLRGKDKEKV